MKRLAFLLSTTIFLAACSSVGLQYTPPTAEEKSAELSISEDNRAFLIRLVASTSLAIDNFDEKGCYAGATNLKEGSTVKLHADRPVVISIDKILNNKWLCRSFFLLTPEENARYTLASESVSQCIATLSKSATEVGEKDVPVPIKYLPGPRGFGCMKISH